jgi:adenosylhomocysteinase
VKPESEGAVDKYSSRMATAFTLLAKGRLVNLGCATGHPSFVMSPTPSPTRCWRRSISGTKREALSVPASTVLPKHLDEEVARLHLEKIGVEDYDPAPRIRPLTSVFTVEGPYKSEHYRY